MLGLLSNRQSSTLVARSSVSPAHASTRRPRLTPSSEHLFSSALHDARRARYKSARGIFETLLQHDPCLCRAWVSYAMMEKKAAPAQERWERCRQVLKRGLSLNPQSACLTQAFGLMELQRGNLLAATMLLERCVRIDPCNEPVLKWVQVKHASQTVGSRRRRRNDSGNINSSEVALSSSS